MRLMNPENESEFHWIDWIDSAMATMEGYGEALKKENKPIRMRPFRKLCLDDGWMKIVIGEKEVRMWKGWPPFDTKICQYEINQFIEARNLKWKRDPEENWYNRLLIDGKIHETEEGLSKILNKRNGENKLPNFVSLGFDDDGHVQICETKNECNLC